ncbi:hypothetical protein BX600DRAFT_514078 [Xylariales sp. PMI_506]|nr:hypothetical protein BX600DRAFT_514078 [Xylariales sp. PMI_506]
MAAVQDVEGCAENALYQHYSSGKTGRPQLQRELDKLRAEYATCPKSSLATQSIDSIGFERSNGVIQRQLFVTDSEAYSPDGPTNASVISNAAPSSIMSNTSYESSEVPRTSCASSGLPDMFLNATVYNTGLDSSSLAAVLPAASLLGQDAPGMPIDPGPPAFMLPRPQGALKISVRKIDDCFALFYEHYAPVVAGIFDCDRSPKNVYQYSEYLFWAIVWVGSRKYARDPTISESIPRPLLELSQKALFDPENAIPAIQATLLLCLWPLPINSAFKDRSHAMAGAATHLAMQQGLPYASRKQDFVRVPLDQPQSDETFRARLWATCEVVFQNTSIYDGFPCSTSLDQLGVKTIQDNDSILSNGWSTLNLYEYHLHQVQTEAVTVMLRTASSLENSRESNVLDSLIDYYDGQAQIISPGESNRDSACFALNSVRLLIRCFHFFTIARDSTRSAEIFSNIYSISCDLLETGSRLDRDQDLGDYATQFQVRLISLAAICILRVHRSIVRAHVDIEQGEDMFFEAIRLLKKHSIQNNDLEIRLATILTQLWSSTRVFKFKDGTVDGLQLLLRGRLSMSVMFDCLWWWRTEFGGKVHPYVELASKGTPSSMSGPRASLVPSAVAVACIPEGEISLAPDPLFDPLQIPNWDIDRLLDASWNWN